MSTWPTALDSFGPVPTLQSDAPTHGENHDAEREAINALQSGVGTVATSRLVQRFPDVAARDAAIPSPVAGMVCAVAGRVQRNTDGTTAGWVSLGPPERVIYTTSGTFTKGDYPGATRVRVVAVAAGGGGGGAGATDGADPYSAGGGGGAGGWLDEWVDLSSLAASETVTVGVGGAGGVGAAAGSAGGDTTVFGFTVTGGQGGQSIAVSGLVFALARGGSAGGGAAGVTGLTGSGGQGESTHIVGERNMGGQGGASGVAWSIAGGAGNAATATGSDGGDGVYGGGGGGGANRTGQAATRTGGAGGDGLVVIEVW